MKLALLLERAFMEDAERDAMLAQMVKNPETNQDITVKTALAYDKNHPARKAAAKIYAQYMNKKNTSKTTPQQQTPQARPAQQTTPQAQSAQPRQFTPRPKSNYANKYRNMRQRRNNSWDSDDGYDAMRDRAAERGTWGRGRSYDPYYDPQDYR
jgi:hypothetical protein